MLKKRSLPLIFNVIIFFLCLLIGGKYYIDTKAYVQKSGIYIAPKFHETAYFLNLDQLEMGSYALEGYKITYESMKDTAIKAESRRTEVKLIYTNSDYFHMNNYLFLYGGSWPEDYQNAKVIILSENTAWEIFGSLNVVSKHVKIGEDFYEICGVVRQEGLEDDFYGWIPYALGEEAQAITGIYLFQEDYNRLEALLSGEAFLSAAGVSKGNYNITDLNQYRQNILNKFGILFCFFTIYSAVFLGKKAIEAFAAKDWLNILFWGAGFAVAFIASVFIIGYVDRNLAVTTERFHLKSILKILNNTDVFLEKSRLSYNMAKLEELNEKSIYALAIGIFGFINMVLHGKPMAKKGGEALGETDI